MKTNEPRLETRAWWRERLVSDLPASFVAFLVALPLCMGIAIASGAPVTSGLVSGIVGGLIAGTLAGSPLQVSGPAAGLTVIVYQCIQKYGIEELGAVVLLAGALQILAGLARLGQWFRAVSPAVVQGMLAGIGVLIFTSQFHVMVDDKPRDSPMANLFTIPEAIAKAAPWQAEDDLLDRGTRLELLRQTGDLHLKQTEIGEQVHHWLTGIESPTGSGDSSSVAPLPVGSSAEAAEADRVAGERLHTLVTAQAGLIEKLRETGATLQSDQVDAALAAADRALADLEGEQVHTARASQDAAAAAIAELRASLKSHRSAAAIGVLTIGVLLVWQAVAARRIRYIPGPLAAAVAATVAAAWFDLPVLYVEVPDNLLEEIYLPSLAELRSLFQPGLLLMAAQIAVVASAQTLLCATAVDQMHNGPRTRYDRELFAQGVGNMACGLLSALPIAGVIVRSSANIQAGAKTRWSAVMHGVWLLLFVVGLSFVLRMIPTASLAAILVYTGYKLVNPKTIRSLLVYGRGEAAIYAATLAGVVLLDLLWGVAIGVALSAVKLLSTMSKLRVSLILDPSQRRTTLTIRGSATFLRLPKLARALERIPPDSQVRVDIERLALIDHACLDLLVTWEKQHVSSGGTVEIDWNELMARSDAESAKSPVVPAGHARRSRASGDRREVGEAVDRRS